MNTRKTLGMLIKIAVPVIVLLVVIFIRFRTSSGDGFSLARYAVINIEGVDGRGRAYVSIDEVGITRALLKENASNEETELFKKFLESISYSLDIRDNLNNGDVINVTAQYSKTAADRLGIKIDKVSGKCVVKGLKQGKKLDAFADVDIVTGGASPFITVSCENKSGHEYLKTLKYTVDRPHGNAIGDVITVACNADEKEAAERGFYFDSLVKQYTISSADRYADSAEDIGNAFIDAVAKEAIGAISEITNETTSHITYEITGDKSFLYRDGNEEAVNFSVCGAELVNNSTSYAAKHQNYLLVYMYGQIRIPDYSGSEDPYEYIDAYFCFIYSDLVVTRDGVLKADTDNIKQRYVCAGTYEEARMEASSVFGPGFSYKNILTK